MSEANNATGRPMAPQILVPMVAFATVIVVVGVATGWGYWVGVVLVLGAFAAALGGLTALVSRLIRTRAPRDH